MNLVRAQIKLLHIGKFHYVFKKELEFNEDEGMSAPYNIETVMRHAGGPGKCTFTCKDARNYLDGYRRQKMKPLLGNDALVLTEYFEKKRLQDPNLFFTYSFDDDGRLENIFWADGRARAAYRHFHDVLVLDSKYLTNRY